MVSSRVRLSSGPAEGGGGERPRAGQTDPGGEEGVEDGAVQRKRDEGESGAAADLRAPEQRFGMQIITPSQIKHQKNVNLHIQVGGGC